MEGAEEMDLTRDSSPGLSERASRLQRITKGDQVISGRQQQAQTPSVVPAPPVEGQGLPHHPPPGDHPSRPSATAAW
eukprot:2738873-Prorocentrum_lima.AAC.1